jgi:hypothetical protein
LATVKIQPSENGLLLQNTNNCRQDQTSYSVEYIKLSPLELESLIDKMMEANKIITIPRKRKTQKELIF